MAAQIEIMDSIKSTIATLLPELPSVSNGRLPEAGGISAQIAPGYTEAVYMNMDARQIMPVLFLAKSADQKEAAAWLFDICNALQFQTSQASGDSWEILRTETATTPQYIGKDDADDWLYSAIVNIDYIIKE